jgi:hypothetical protein
LGFSPVILPVPAASRLRHHVDKSSRAAMASGASGSTFSIVRTSPLRVTLNAPSSMPAAEPWMT